MKVQIKLTNGIMPKKATQGAAAYDLYVPETVLIQKGRNVVPMGFSIQMEYGIEGLIDPRSGFSAKGMEGIAFRKDELQSAHVSRFDADVIEGKIDSDYRGEVGVIICNRDEPFFLVKGTRCAQLTFVRVEDADFAQCETLEESTRGNGGFGHTGSR